MEDVVDSLDDVAHDLLQILDLDVAVEHQERVRNRHVYPLNCVVVSFARSVAVFLRWTCCVLGRRLHRSMHDHLVSHPHAVRIRLAGQHRRNLMRILD